METRTKILFEMELEVGPTQNPFCEWDGSIIEDGIRFKSSLGNGARAKVFCEFWSQNHKIYLAMRWN